MTESLKKTVFITGAGKGIGLSLAQIFIRHQWRVYALVRSRQDAERLNKMNCTVLLNDICDQNMSRQLVDIPKGSIDVLINNAGVSGNGKKTLDYSLEHLHDLFYTNVIGTLNVIKSLKSYLNTQGLVINLSSRFGSFGYTVENTHQFCTSSYRVTKASLNMLTLSLALEREGDLRYAVIHPGQIKTSMGASDAIQSPDDAANAIFKLLPSIENGGFYNAQTGEKLPW